MAEVIEKTGVLTHTAQDGTKYKIYPDVKTDAGLNVEGKPADSKAVGDALEEIRQSIASATYVDGNEVDW